MVEIKTPAEIQAMRASGRVVAQILATVRGQAKAGTRLTDGDLLSVDCGAVLDGWAADAAISFTIGPPRAADVRLIATTEAALRAGIAAGYGTGANDGR